MTFTSMLFLFLFLPISLAFYYLSNDRAREYVLLAISLLFYSLASLPYLGLLVVLTVVNVCLGRGIARSARGPVGTGLLTVGVLLNAGLLATFKYEKLALSLFGGCFSSAVQGNSILLPLGLSFFTFKSISYFADVYSGRAELAENPVHDALYLSFFAQIQSGPLTRYGDMTLISRGRLDPALFSDGVFRFLVGFNKKVLLADVLAHITAEVFATPIAELSTGFAWLGSVCYSLQLFFDFAGYSDMAIGVSEMFGYPCMENFNYPYMTESVSRFWRRWHISLSSWFRDYIYIPLGGSRCREKWRVYCNLLAVWVLTGLWHGTKWNFVVWGLGYFAAISFERLTGLPEKLKSPVGRFLYRIPVLFFINFQWVMFNARGFRENLRFIAVMLSRQSNALLDSRAAFLLKDYGCPLALAVVLCFPLVPWLDRKLKDRGKAHLLFEAVLALLVGAGFLWAVSFLVAGQNNPFVYANF